MRVRKNRRKGISPLIAAVLLIAFTVSLGALIPSWTTDMVQDVQDDTSEQAEKVAQASRLGVEILSVSFNRSTDNLEVTVQNKGDDIEGTNLSVGVAGGGVAKNRIYDMDLSSKEVATIKLPLDRTYPIEMIRVDLTGYPVSDESGIKCAPTRGLVGYWTFNDEQTENGWALDISGYGNNGSLEGGVTTSADGEVGEAYRFDGGDSVEYSGDVFVGGGDGVSVSYWFNVGKSDNGALELVNTDAFNTYAYTDSAPLRANFGVFNESVDFKTSGTSQVLDFGSWYHYTGVYDDSEGRNELWIDGKLESRGGTLGDVRLSDNYQVSGRREHEGYVDELRIYNRSLSPKEVRRLGKVRGESWAVDGCKLTS